MPGTRSLVLCALLGLALVGCENDEDPDGGGGAVDGGAAPACRDGVDNDGDGLIDFPDDPGCVTADDDDEADDAATECADGVDNDGDGRVDLADPGCANAADDDESDDPPPPQCSDGEDNDDDGRIDFPEDPGCASSTDDNEGDDPVPPQCSDGVDNDSDGYTDFPADPGCGSAFDDDERDDTTTPLPQCGDGIDNDGDGLVDLADPGCVSAADPREQDPETPPPCFNGLDDDGDGVIDFPLEPGCSAAGDEDETDPDTSPQCGNGLDDDRDGLTDYPYDPGCAGVGDRDETDPVVRPACSDGLDNDRDGAIDFPADRGCASAADGTETGNCGTRYEPVEIQGGRVLRGELQRGRFETEGSCGGRGAPEAVFLYRIDSTVEALEITTALEGTEVETAIYVRRTCLNGATELACRREALNDGVAGNTLRVEEPAPGDYYIFVDGAAGRGGRYALKVEEIPLAQCRNGLDDDGDGRTDFPNDPGCESLEDRDEADPDPLPQCADDLDNDGDGLVDFPLDLGCESAADDDEVDVCGQGIRVADYPVGQPFLLTTTEDGSNQFAGSCGGQNAREKVFRYRNRFNANLRFSVNHPETVNNTLVYVRQQCLDNRTELGCATGEGVERRGSVRLERAAPGDYYVFVDHPFGLGGPIKLSVDVERLPPGCSDGIDNDGDGFTDADDPGCATPEDEDERDPAVAPTCWNRMDDDGDGLVDYPFDPGCVGKGDADEADPPVPPACSNGVDDDDDGRIDYPADDGCSAAGDDDEVSPRRRPECANRIDDDQDGLLDYPHDPGCSAPGDLSETDDDELPACWDGRDNDRDGLVDFPYDPGCAAAGHNTEVDPDPPFACSNGMDDDGDGHVDFPRDPGCTHAGDDDETSPAFPPECANGRDDDGNGRIDWPDDPGCRFAADSDESSNGVVPARCADGVDNDDDGFVDLADVGCANARDNDEADPDVAPFCADGVDNDQDGIIDWPQDDGCAARGDECEQEGYGLCDGVCLDIRTDAQNCGRCGRVCDDGVECIDGFCGGLFVFEGIRQNVPEDNLGGWELCHRDLFADRSPLGPIRQACNGEFVMMGCRRVGQPNYQLLAMGQRDAVFRDVGNAANAVHNHNGVDWYYSPSYSWGFVAPGTGVQRNSCDVANVQPELRMCWHTSGDALSGGYRCGATAGLNGARDWERVVFTSR